MLPLILFILSVFVVGAVIWNYTKTEFLVLTISIFVLISLFVFIFLMIITLKRHPRRTSKRQPRKTPKKYYQEKPPEKITNKYYQKRLSGSRKPFSKSTKKEVKISQGYTCAICNKIPQHWNFDHIDSRADNSFENCQGLCLDCHMTKTNEERTKRDPRR